MPDKTRKAKLPQVITMLNIHEYTENEDGQIIHIPTGEILTQRDIHEQYDQALSDKLDFDSPYEKLPWKPNDKFVKTFSDELSTLPQLKYAESYHLIILFIGNIQWASNEVLINKKPPSNEALVKLTNSSIRMVSDYMKELESYKIIKRIGKGKSRRIYLNPKYAFNGRMILKETTAMFLANCAV